MITEENVISFLKTQMGLDAGSFDGETKLFTSGLLDSFAIVEVVAFIESQGKIKIDPSELVLENFNSVKDILQFSSSKLTAQ